MYSKCTCLYINGLYLINLFELHLIDNHILIVQRKLPSFRQLANFATLVSAFLTGPQWVRKACKLNKIMLKGLGRPSDGPGIVGCHGNAK